MDKKKEFAEIYKSNVSIVYRYIYARLFNKTDVEDLTSKTFEIAYRKFMEPDFGKLKNPKSWLIQIARNVMGNRIKKKKIKTVEVDEVQIADSDLPIDDVVVNESQIDQIKKYFGDLDADTREVISLRIWEDYKFREIAELMDLNESTVRSLYHRGIKKIRSDMKEAKEFAIVFVGLRTLAKNTLFKPGTAFIKSTIVKINLDIAKMVLGKTITLFGKIIPIRNLVVGVLVAVVGLGAVGGATYYAIENYGEEDNKKESDKGSKDEDSDTDDQEEEGNTLVYVNEEYGYKVVYPEEYTLREDKPETVYFEYGKYEVSVNVNLQGIGIECPTLLSETEVYIDGIIGTKSLYDYAGCNNFDADRFVVIGAQNGDNMFHIFSTYKEGNKSEDLYESFLGGFEFVEDDEDNGSTGDSGSDLESVKTKTCKSDKLQVSVKVPEDWDCEVDNDLGDIHGIMSLSGGIFNVEISNLGRGPYCGDGPGEWDSDEDACVVTSFYTRGDIGLSMYKSYGENKEIFGGIHNDAGVVWLSAKYDGMEDRDLTSAEKELLFGVFDSIKVLE